MTFVKGKSGNPGGRPKLSTDVRDLAREYTKESIERLAYWMKSKDARASVAASQVLIDRGWGKPVQPHVGDEDQPISVIIKRIINGSSDDDDPTSG